MTTAIGLCARNYDTIDVTSKDRASEMGFLADRNGFADGLGCFSLMHNLRSVMSVAEAHIQNSLPRVGYFRVSRKVRFCRLKLVSQTRCLEF